MTILPSDDECYLDHMLATPLTPVSEINGTCTYTHTAKA